MKWLSYAKIRLVLVVFVAAIVHDGGSAYADFTFGSRTNLGPGINSLAQEGGPSISADGLEFYLMSNRSGGYGGLDLWVCTRPTTDDNWSAPVNLGPTVNSASRDGQPEISVDGLSLFFDSDRPGGQGFSDLWMTTRATKNDPWKEPVNLGPTINTADNEWDVSCSADGLELYFCRYSYTENLPTNLWVATRATKNDPWAEAVYLTVSNPAAVDCSPHILPDGMTLLFVSGRPGGYGNRDIWITTRQTKDADWAQPVNLGPALNSQYGEDAPNVSRCDYMLYYDDYFDPWPGGYGSNDIWQVPIIPIVDFNGDGIVDAADMCIMVDHWGTDDPLYDIGPMPWGDGIVDVQDLVVLAEHLFEELTLVAHWPLDEAQGEIAYDSVGGYDGTLVGGPTWQTDAGMVTGALQFDGIDDYVITDYVLDPADGPFSIFACIQGGIPGQVVISQQSMANWLTLDAEGNLMTELKCTGRSAGPLISETVITDGQWHRIGLVWDGSHRTLYVDGIVVAEDTQPGLTSSQNGLYIGTGKAMESDTYFSGLIDDVRIYNRAVAP